MSSKSQHVMPNSGKWSLRAAGSTRASHTFATQGEAIEAGRRIARSQKTELYIHGSDGRIRDRLSFGDDATTAKG